MPLYDLEALAELVLSIIAALSRTVLSGKKLEVVTVVRIKICQERHD